MLKVKTKTRNLFTFSTNLQNYNAQFLIPKYENNWYLTQHIMWLVKENCLWKDTLVSRHENKIEHNTLPLYCFCVTHSAQQFIIIIMSIALICLARVIVRKRLNKNFSVKRINTRLTNIYFITCHHNAVCYKCTQ